MKSTVTRSVEVTLVLTKQEADWLHNVMQNPLFGQHVVCNEPKEDNEMRRKFWEATQTAP